MEDPSSQYPSYLLARQSASGMADQRKVSDAIVAESQERSCVFKIHGYSRLKELFKNDYAGEVFLVLDSADGKHVNTQAKYIRVLGKYGLPSKSSFANRTVTNYPLSRRSHLGHHINRATLEQSGDIIDECISIKCDFTLDKDIHSEETVGNRFVVVPPTNLHLHFGNLLKSMVGADVTFYVGGQKFLAHRFVLAARSSVFNAELLGAMKENVGSPIVIHEMEPDVFKSLLHFIYTDSLPALEISCNEGEARPDVAMAGHLLVAADRYNVERLKLICEHKLSSHIDANTVATSLALSEQHSCHGLKEACLQFLSSPSNLKAMIASDGYEHLKSSCPSALKELIVRLLPVEMEVAKDIVMAI